MTDTMSRLRVYWHDDCLLHDGGMGVFEGTPSDLIVEPEKHVESAQRVANIKGILERGPIADRIDWHDGRHAEDDEILAFHTAAYLDEVKAADANPEQVHIDGAGTIVNDGTLTAARAAAGTTLDAMRALMDDPAAGPAYSLIRPPGHHAQPERADGNCLFNNLGLAVLAARDKGAERVAVVDWDVHHGNGTQAGFYDRDDVLTISIHMDHRSWGPFHPELGTADEVGRGAGVGFNRNIPLPFGVGDQCYEAVMQELVVPLVDDFRPDVLVVAAGEDANAFDPNGRQMVTMAGFRRLGLFARDLAQRHCGGRLLLVQEGGYSPTYTAFSAYGMVEGVLGIAEGTVADPIAFYPERSEHGLAEIPRIRAAWDAAMAKAA